MSLRSSIGAAALLGLLVWNACGGDEDAGGAGSGAGGAAAAGAGGAGGQSAGGSAGAPGGAGGSGGAQGGAGGAAGGAGGAAGGPPAMEVVATAAGGDWVAVAQDAGHLYVAYTTTLGGGVKVVAKSDGTVSDLMTATGCAEVAVSGTTVLATCDSASTPGKRAIFRVPAAGGASAEAAVAVADQFGGLTADGTTAYFCDGGYFKSVPAVSGIVSTISSLQFIPAIQPQFPALGATTYYIAWENHIYAAPLDGSSVLPVSTLQSGYYDLELDATSLYFVHADSAIRRFWLSGGAPQPITGAEPATTLSALGLDAGMLYFVGVAGGPVLGKVSVDGGTMTALALAPVPRATELLIDSTTVWMLATLANTPQIWKAPK
ncbi:MAG: hypothetical protein IT373_34805 [Polyangiaceae bacterium]|nr:hypothetical protein [Polyangiaceae bacterium]